MEIIDYSKYNIERIYQEDNTFDDVIRHLSGIINDRSIPEAQKQLVRKQLDEIIKMKINTVKPIIIKLTPKK